MNQKEHGQLIGCVSAAIILGFLILCIWIVKRYKAQAIKKRGGNDRNKASNNTNAAPFSTEHNGNAVRGNLGGYSNHV